MGGRPWTAAQLDLTLAPFGASRLLPRAAYVDAEVHQWEVDSWFEGGWVCVGR